MQSRQGVRAEPGGGAFRASRAKSRWQQLQGHQQPGHDAAMAVEDSGPWPSQEGLPVEHRRVPLGVCTEAEAVPGGPGKQVAQLSPPRALPQLPWSGLGSCSLTAAAGVLALRLLLGSSPWGSLAGWRGGCFPAPCLGAVSLPQLLSAGGPLSPALALLGSQKLHLLPSPFWGGYMWSCSQTLRDRKQKGSQRLEMGRRVSWGPGFCLGRWEGSGHRDGGNVLHATELCT